MQPNLQDNLSYIIRTDGEFVPAMPDDGEFSAQEIRDYVAGPPEIACFTPDGYTLFQNSDASSTGLGVNHVATSLRQAASDSSESIYGRVFLAHPDHIPAHWKASAAQADLEHRK
jgi:hypothetical protein